MGIVSAVWLVILGVVSLLLGLQRLARPGTPGAWTVIILALIVCPLSALWGLWGLASAGMHVDWLRHFPVYWIITLVGALVEGGVGVFGFIRAIIALTVRVPGPPSMPLMALSIVAIVVGFLDAAAVFIYS